VTRVNRSSPITGLKNESAELRRFPRKVIDCSYPHAVQLTTREIVGERDFPFLQRPDEDVGGLGDVGRVGNLERPVSAVRGILQPDVALLLAK